VTKQPDQGGIPSEDELARLKAEYDLGWLPTDEPVVNLSNEFVEAIKAGTEDGWTYEPDGELIRFGQSR
jgi:hypothetical protein